MSFSSGAFSSAAFGESYAEIDVVVTLAGVLATGVINGTGLDVRSIVTVNLTGVEGDTAAGVATVVGDASTLITGVAATTVSGTVVAKAGATTNLVGVSGVGQAGSVLILGESLLTLDSTEATSTAGTIAVTADAATSLVGVASSAIAGDLTTSAEAVVLTSSTVATANAGNVTITADASTPLFGITSTVTAGTASVFAKASVTLVGVSAQAITDDPFVTGDEVVIEADAAFLLQSVSGAVTNNEVTVASEAVVTPSSVVLSTSIGAPATTTVQFDYEALKENYSRQRTEYIRGFDNTSRTVFVEPEQTRVVYIEPQAGTRKAYARAA